MASLKKEREEKFNDEDTGKIKLTFNESLSFEDEFAAQEKPVGENAAAAKQADQEKRLSSALDKISALKKMASLNEAAAPKTTAKKSAAKKVAQTGDAIPENGVPDEKSIVSEKNISADERNIAADETTPETAIEETSLEQPAGGDEMIPSPDTTSNIKDDGIMIEDLNGETPDPEPFNYFKSPSQLSTDPKSAPGSPISDDSVTKQVDAHLEPSGRQSPPSKNHGNEQSGEKSGAGNSVSPAPSTGNITCEDSCELMPDDSELPETPLTANTSFQVDDGQTCEERGDTKETGDVSFSDDNHHGGDLELPDNNIDITKGNCFHFPNPPSSPHRPSSSNAAAPGSGSQKRCRSPSPPPARDAPSAVEHEGPAMSGKSPGAKRRRLDKNASSPDAQAEPPAATSKASSKRSREGEGSDGSEDEGEVISAKRIKTVPEVETNPDHAGPPHTPVTKGDAFGSSQDGSGKLSEAEGSAGGERWSMAVKRYNDNKNNSGLPDYGPQNHRVYGPKPEHQTPESMRGRHAGQGNFRPVNRLSSHDSPSADRAKPKLAAAAKAFDFYGDTYKRPDHNPNKKQKVEGGFRKEATPRYEIEDEIEDDSPVPRRSRGDASMAISGPSSGHDGSLHDSGDARSPGTPRWLRGMRENVPDSEPVKLLISEKYAKGLVPLRGRKLLPAKAKRPVNGEDMTIHGGGSRRMPQVKIRGLPGSPYKTPQQPSTRARGVAAAQLIDSEDSMDDLSAGHYKTIPPPSVPEMRKRSQQQPLKRKADVVQAETIHDTSEEEIDVLEKGNIKSTAFPASKKAAPKDKKPGQDRFRVLQVFSSSHPWFLGDVNQEWFVAYNRMDGILKIEHKDAPPQAMTTACISLVEYSEECAMLKIHKSRDNTFGGSTQIHLTLASSSDSERLAKALGLSASVIKLVPKSRDHLEKVFATARKSAVTTSKKVRPASEEPASVSEFVQKPRGRPKANAPATRGPRIIDQLGNDDAESTKKTRGPKNAPSLPGKSESITQIFFDLTGDEVDAKPTASTSEVRPEATRRSSRQRAETPRSRRGSVEEVQWSEVNPEWRQNWKRSIVYPPKGKDKATIHADDIWRLDEGQYLNDNLIEFYIRWLEGHTKPAEPETSKRVYIMNTFFYDRLTTTPKGNRGFNYEAVERWTAKIDLLSYDYIVVPVNEAAHWYLAIICNVPRLLGTDPESQVQGASEGASQSQEDGALQKTTETSPKEARVTSDVVQVSSQAAPQTPTKKGKKKTQGPPPRKHKTDELKIITLDSLSLRHSPTCINLREYLVEEIKSKRGIEIPTPGAIGMTAANIPRQNNNSDCGLFLLNYLEKFLQQPEKFVRGILQNKPGFLTSNWRSAADTRTRIRNLLFDLQKQSVEDNGSLSESNKSEQPYMAESRSPEETTSTRASSEQAVQPPIREQSVTTPSPETSPQGMSRLASLGAGEVGTADVPKAPIYKSTRQRSPTPFPSSPGKDAEDEVNALESPGTAQHGMELGDDHIPDTHGEDAANGGPEDEGAEDNVSQMDKPEGEKVGESPIDGEVMLLDMTPTGDERRTTRSTVRSPSPQLLSDESFSTLSSSSTTPESIAPPAASDARIPKDSGPPKSHDAAAFEVDAADRAIIGRAAKKLKKH